MTPSTSALSQLLTTSIERLEAQLKPLRENRQKIILTGYLVRSALNDQAIATLSRADLTSEAAPLVRQQIEMRLRGLVLCSPYGDYAAALLFWHEELRNRLRYLHLEHLEAFSDALPNLLPHTKTEEQNVLVDWFGQKPRPSSDEAAWLHNWHLWSLERLLFEIRKHLVESPRVKKEIENLTAYAADHETAATLAGLKRYILLDEELDLVTLKRTGEEAWPEGPIALSNAAIIDLLSDINGTFELGLDDEIEACRLRLNAGQFGA